MPKIASPIHFVATLHRPAGVGDVSWSFLNLPQAASDQLPTRSMASVEGTMNGFPIIATFEPDGKGGHWLKIDRELKESAQLSVGDDVEFEIAPVTKEPEPKVPEDLAYALEQAPERARESWYGTTPLARRDWIYWIVTGKKAETRVKRIEVAIDKLAKGSKRPCCFDRAGIASKSLSCPVAEVVEDR